MVGFDSNKGNVLTQLDYAFSGVLSGSTSRLVVQPLDVIKIRLQLQVEPLAQTTGAVGGKYTGLVQAYKCIMREEGMMAMWKGHLPAQIQAISFSLAQFISFEFCTEHVWPSLPKSFTSNLAPLSHFICGNMAGGFACLTTQPFDVLRTRFIAQGEPKVYRTMLAAISTIMKREGFSGLYRGMVPSLMLIAPQTGLQFAFYKLTNDAWYLTKEHWREFFATGDGSSTEVATAHIENPNIGALQSLFAGGVAGMVSKTAVYPLDFVKKRMQVQGFEEARTKFGKLHVSQGFMNCFFVIAREEGYSAFFKGLKPALVKSGLSIAMRFATYEQCLNAVKAFRTESES